MISILLLSSKPNKSFYKMVNIQIRQLLLQSSQYSETQINQFYKMRESQNSKGQLSVFLAVIRFNILLNVRRYLFQREMLLILPFIITIFLTLEYFLNAFYPQNPPLQQIISLYVIYTLMFITRMGIIEYADHKDRYFYAQKADGLSGYNYLAAWGVYSIISGFLKTLVVVALTYAFFTNQNIHSDSLQITIDQLCLMIVVAYFTFYSYSLFFNAILPYNFLGIRLLTPLFLCVIIQEIMTTQMQSTLPIWLNPARWVIAILYENFIIDDNYSYSFFMNIALAQFFVPLIAAITIQVIKFKRFQIKNWVLSIMRRKGQMLQEYLIPQEANSSSKGLQIILLKNIEKSFGKQKVLEDISLEIFSSELIVLSGKNSSGKTTLLETMASIATITTGVMLKKEGIRIGMCFQESHSFEEFTVKENLYFYGRFKNLSKLQSRIDYLLESFELNEIANKKVYELSGGNKKKLSLALTFLGKKDLVLIDEPTLGVDVVIKKEIWRILRRQRVQNSDTCFIDPELELINMATRFLALEEGRLTVDCTLQELQQFPSFMIVEIKNVKKDNETVMRPFKRLQQQRKIEVIPRTSGEVGFYLDPIFWQQFKRVLAEHSLFENISMIWIAHLKDKLYRTTNKQTQKVVPNTIEGFTWLLLISQITTKQYRFRALKACILVRVTQVVPNTIEGFTWLLLIPVLWLLLILSFKGEQKSVLQWVTQFYQSYCYYLFPQIYYTHDVRSRQRKEEEMMLVHGLKKASYWFISIVLDILLLIGQYFVIVIIFVLYNASGWPTSQDMKIMIGMFCCLISITIIVKIYSLFFKHSIFAFTFVPFILTTVNFFLSWLFIYMPFTQNLNSFWRLFAPIMQYGYVVFNNPSYFEIFICLFVQVVIYSTILTLIPTIRFRFRYRQKKINSQVITVINSIDKINEKLRVTDWEQSNTEKDEITIENLYLQYSKTTVIKEMYLGVAKGTIFGLLGRNGSGKTTTLRLASSLISRTTGYVYFDNKTIDSASSPIYEVMGYCPQFDYFHPEMTVVRHLTIVLIFKGVPLQYHKEMREVMLQVFDMQSALKKKIKLLSEGEKCKLKIITALLCNPKGKYVLLDEPTVGLDQASQQTFAALLLRAAKELQMTFLYITHRISEAEQLCDRVGILQRGEFININSPKQLVSEFSRGHTITIKAKDIDKLREKLQPKMQSLFQINEWRQDEKQGTVQVCIPRLYFSMGKAIAVLELLQLDPNCVFYCLKEDDFEEVFDYLATRNRQENDFRQRETEMINMTI